MDAVETLGIFHTIAPTSVRLITGVLEREHIYTTSLSLPLKPRKSQGAIHINHMSTLSCIIVKLAINLYIARMLDTIIKGPAGLNPPCFSVGSIIH